jgi:hypothetical protein
MGYSTMSRLSFPKTLLLVVAAISLGTCFEAAGQPAAAHEKKIVSLPGDPSAQMRGSGPQVYLMRGFLNVFSLGMDILASELHRVGISATVANHTSWRGLAEEIATNYKAGRRGPIVLVGHSFGADAVMSMGEYLGQQGVPVALIVPFDATSSHQATANVARVLNLYKSDDVMVTRGPGFHGQLTNYYDADPNINHMNIDKDEKLHAMVISRIRALGSTRSVRSAVSTSAGKSG